MDTNNIIVIATGLNGLGAVRSAAHAGLNVITLLFNAKDLAYYSRYAKFKYLLRSDPSDDEFVARLKSIYTEHGACTIVTCSDSAAELVSNNAKSIAEFHYLVTPNRDTVRLLNDKKFECAVMKDAGVCVPASYLKLEDITSPTLPLLIKPRTYRDYAVLGKKNLLISSAAEWTTFKSQFARVLDRFIAQEVITGQDQELWVCNVTFDKNNTLRSCFVFQRLGTMPSHYGVTSIAISHRNAELIEECKKIGRALAYTGPAMIEFKRCPITNQYYYIETNPRLGMCNWFDTRCGVNNVLATHLISQDKLVPLLEQKNDILFINWPGDLVARIEDRENLLKVLGLYCRYLFHRKVGATFYWKDPIPGFIYTAKVVQSVFQRVMKRLTHSDAKQKYRYQK